MKIKWKPLIISVAIPLLVGGISALLTRNSMQTFDEISKPPLSPPGWLFPVVWTILYTLMGIASYLVLTAKVPMGDKKLPLIHIKRIRAIPVRIWEQTEHIYIWSALRFGIVTPSIYISSIRLPYIAVQGFCNGKNGIWGQLPVPCLEQGGTLDFNSNILVKDITFSPATLCICGIHSQSGINNKFRKITPGAICQKPGHSPCPKIFDCYR